MRLWICTIGTCRPEDDDVGRTTGERTAADDPWHGGDPAPPLRQTQLPLRRRAGAARIDRAELLRGRAQPHRDARAGRDRHGPRCDRSLPGGPGQDRTRGQHRPASAARPPGRGPVTAWAAMLGTFRAVFTAPGFAIFTDLLAGRVRTPSRRTVTGMIAVADPRV